MGLRNALIVGGSLFIIALWCFWYVLELSRLHACTCYMTSCANMAVYVIGKQLGQYGVVTSNAPGMAHGSCCLHLVGTLCSQPLQCDVFGMCQAPRALAIGQTSDLVIDLLCLRRHCQMPQVTFCVWWWWWGGEGEWRGAPACSMCCCCTSSLCSCAALHCYCC